MRFPTCDVCAVGAAVLTLACAWVAPASGQQVGDPMPAVAGSWIQGPETDMATWSEGTVYLLDLWGTWCAPCLALMPSLSELHERYRGEGFAVVGYSWEEPDKVRRFLSEHRDRTRYFFLNDPQERTMQELSEAEAIEGFPSAYLIGELGVIRWKGPGQDADRAVSAFFRDRAGAAEDTSQQE